MSLKIKTILILFCAALVICTSYGTWKTIELEKSRNRILTLESQLKLSGYQWIEYLGLYSQVYGSYIKNKESIHASTGNKTSVLIYRYSKFMCNSCFLEDLQEIERLQKEVGKQKILVLPAYPDNREGRIELSKVLSKFNYVNIPLDTLIIPSISTEIMQRYFALIDKEGNLSMVFFPLRGETDLTRFYFSEVKSILKDE